MLELNQIPDPTDPIELTNNPAFVEHAERVLGGSELADNLEPTQLARLAAIAVLRTYRPGDLVCNEHEHSDELYIIDSGSLEVWLDPASIGQEDRPLRRIAELQAGQACGELALLDGGVRSAQVKAGNQGARLAAFQRDRLLELCERDPLLGFRLMRNLASALALRMRVQDMQLYDK